MSKLRALKGALFIFSAVLILGASFHRKVNSSLPNVFLEKQAALTKEQIAKALRERSSIDQFPKEIDLSIDGKENVHSRVRYSFNSKLQKTMEGLFETYGPDYGAFVAIDATTGQVLSMVSYSRARDKRGNLALRATFPSASVFKVVTAAAAIEGQKFSPETLIPFHGRRHTLYRGQIFKQNVRRGTQFITLREAFAHSINTVFGKIGAFTVGPAGLREYADRFGFNRKIETDLPVQEGHAPIPDDAWGLAEAASGYTRDNTMSPLQGALIGAAVANNGVIMEPFAVQSVVDSNGMPLYSAQPKVLEVAMSPSTANEMKILMKETVLKGTSRHSFKGFFKKNFAALDVGGKTGSLTGTDPYGKYDWFVGYADSGMRKIAFSALTIHQKQWRVKSSYLARRAIESFFKESIPTNLAQWQ